MISSQTIASLVEKVDKLLETDPSDTRHLFWEEMERLFFAMREVEPDDIDEDILEQFLSMMSGVFNALIRIDKRRRERHKLLAKANG